MCLVRPRMHVGAAVRVCLCIETRTPSSELVHSVLQQFQAWLTALRAVHAARRIAPPKVLVPCAAASAAACVLAWLRLFRLALLCLLCISSR